MQIQNDELFVFDDINERELSELDMILKAYTVDVPDQSVIDDTVDMLSKYVCKTEEASEPGHGKLYDILYNSLNEVKFINKYFWLVNFIIFLVGFYITQTDINILYKPYLIIILIAPIPFFTGIIEICRGRDEGVLEIELSCKVTERDIMLSRLFVTGIYNIVLNSCLSVVLSRFSTGLDIFKAVFLWITPFTAVCGIALLISSKMRSSHAVTILVASWIVFVMSTLSQKHVMERLLSLNTGVYLLLSAAGILFSAFQVRNMLCRNIDLAEGVDKIDSKN